MMHCCKLKYMQYKVVEIRCTLVIIYKLYSLKQRNVMLQVHFLKNTVYRVWCCLNSKVHCIRFGHLLRRKRRQQFTSTTGSIQRYKLQ